ncbi:MAG: DUF4065 domain-containing protein [Chloroflexi bacterium]|nr:DUF4065 domain-containing protein [Chloroflexota bacterium]
MYDARQIANEFIQRGLDDQRPLSPLHIQKLVYFAHARHLALHKEPLIFQEFRAWQYGPVVRDLYDDLKSYGKRRVTQTIPLADERQAQIEDHGTIDWSYRSFGHLDTFLVVSLTHEPKGPWERARKSGKAISNDSIREYYAEPWIAENKTLLDRVSRHPEIVADFLQSQKEFEEGRFFSASSPEEMLEQIEQRREERDAEGA